VSVKIWLLRYSDRSPAVSQKKWQNPNFLSTGFNRFVLIDWFPESWTAAGPACQGIAGEHFEKIGEKMQGNACEPLRVTQEAVDAYEKQSGFHGIGKIMVERGCWVIVPKEAVASMRRNDRSNPGGQHALLASSYPGRARAVPAENGGS
jgi:hypothetical protein